MLSKRQYGAAGELRARRYLERCGLAFVEANARTPYGELDLVMREGDELVFVEVKARREILTGDPAEAVTPRKLRYTVRAAEAYRTAHGLTGPWRVDVVAVAGSRVVHLRNVTV